MLERSLIRKDTMDMLERSLIRKDMLERSLISLEQTSRRMHALMCIPILWSTSLRHL